MPSPWVGGCAIGRGDQFTRIVGARDYNRYMKTVSIRDLQDRLSAYLRLVRAGEVIRITDRGEVVAELRSSLEPRGPTAHVGVNRLLEAGAARLEKLEPPNDLYAIEGRPCLPRAEVLALLDDERGER